MKVSAATAPAFTKNELLRDLFQIFDEDGGGDLDGDEVVMLLEAFGRNAVDAAATMTTFDLDNSGTIDFKEFVAMVAVPMGGTFCPLRALLSLLTAHSLLVLSLLHHAFSHYCTLSSRSFTLSHSRTLALDGKLTFLSLLFVFKIALGHRRRRTHCLAALAVGERADSRRRSRQRAPCRAQEAHARNANQTRGGTSRHTARQFREKEGS